jgi:hypothetical protein
LLWPKCLDATSYREQQAFPRGRLHYCLTRGQRDRQSQGRGSRQRVLASIVEQQTAQPLCGRAFNVYRRAFVLCDLISANGKQVVIVELSRASAIDRISRIQSVEGHDSSRVKVDVTKSCTGGPVEAYRPIGSKRKRATTQDSAACPFKSLRSGNGLRFPSNAPDLFGPAETSRTSHKRKSRHTL